MFRDVRWGSGRVVPARYARSRRLRRGSSHVEKLILIALIALAALAGFRAFGGSVGATAQTQGDRVRTLDGTDPQATGSGTADPGDTGDHGDGGFFGGVGRFFGGVADRARDFGNWVSGTAWPFMRDYTFIGFEFGLGKAAWSTVVNVGHAIVHPLETLEGLNYFISHPLSTIYVFGADSWAVIHDHPAQGIGELTFNIASFFIPGGGPTKAVKVATTAASYGSSTVSVSVYGNNASHAQVPGWIQTADNILTWTNPVTMPSRLSQDVWHRIFD